MLTLLKTLSNPSNLKALGMPFAPALTRVLFLTIGILIGIFSVYAGLPLVGMKWRNAEPVHLSEGYKDQWVKNAALIHAAGLYEGDENAKQALESAGYGPDDIQALADANESDPIVQEALLNVKDVPGQDAANSQQGKISTSILSNITPFICVFGYLILFSFLGIVLSFVPIPVGRWRKGAVVGSESTRALSEKERQRREALKSAQDHAGDFEEDEGEALGEPIASFMSAYVLGDDLYDDSFAIEPGGSFAGECGIEISETIGVGDPKKVTAFEVWVFDQQEIQTLTYVVMSEHAYNDQNLRAKLASHGEAVLAAPGKAILLDTKTLHLQIRIIDMEYGEGSLPPNSFFNKMTFALTVWQKEGVGEGALAGVAPLPDMSPPPPPSNFAPPPLPQPGGPPPPTGGTPGQPPGGGIRPLTDNIQGQPLPPPPQPGQQPPPPGGGVRPPGTGSLPPQPLPPQPGQQPPPPGGGIRPLTSNAPGQPPPGSGFRPPSGDPFEGQGRQLPPMPGRQAPPPPPEDDDPFGDTGQM